MKIHLLRMCGLRCFEDTGEIVFDAKCNIIVGRNNSGKSTLLRGVLHWQGHYFDGQDIRPGSLKATYLSCVFQDPFATDPFHNKLVRSIFRGGNLEPSEFEVVDYNGGGSAIFSQARTHSVLMPFLAKRKATVFDQAVNLGIQDQNNGTLGNLYSRVDLLATSGHPNHNDYLSAVREIVGIDITTKSSASGKEAGFYFDKTFVTLERMGDGVTEMVALIVELCLAEDKIFVLEEPETNLHPEGLKALLQLVKKASEKNQFIIATHSNVVVRELGGPETGKIFRVFQDGEGHTAPSRVEEVEQTPAAHMELLRELGYEFTDFSLFEGWLFLEEASAEIVFRNVLIPFFALKLQRRLRTYSAAGVTKLETSVADFKTLMVFVHLEQIYKNRIWVRADGDTSGVEVITKLRDKFPSFEDGAIGTFKAEQFEHYYPSQFQEQASVALATTDKKAKQELKLQLLEDVLAWTKANPEEARAAWEQSAAEPIDLLKSILGSLEKGHA